MMVGTTYGIQNYYTAFTSPIKSYQASPAQNLIFGAFANKAYMESYAKKAQSTVSSYLSSLNSSINDLKASSKPFTSKTGDSSFDQKGVTSSDNSTVNGYADDDATAKSYNLNVSKLATSQTNTGTSLNSKQDSVFAQGTNTFSIIQGGKEAKKVSFTIDEYDTNKSGLEKMAKAINNARAGVTAGVYNDSKTGTSYLKLTSNETGAGNLFSLKDEKGNAVATSSAGNTTTKAQDAEYTLDGKKYTSSKNEITLDNGKVELTLSKAESKDIKVNVGTDKGVIISDIKDFIKSYNNTISLSESYSGDFSGAQKLGDELEQIAKSRKTSLNSIGININSDGTLAVDDKKLEKAVDENLAKVKETLGGYNGVAEKLYDKSNEVLTSPMKYAKPAESSAGYNSFYNYMSASNRTMNSQNLYRGLLIDALL